MFLHCPLPLNHSPRMHSFDFYPMKGRVSTERCRPVIGASSKQSFVASVFDGFPSDFKTVAASILLQVAPVSRSRRSACRFSGKWFSFIKWIASSCCMSCSLSEPAVSMNKCSLWLPLKKKKCTQHKGSFNFLCVSDKSLVAYI